MKDGDQETFNAPIHTNASKDRGARSSPRACRASRSASSVSARSIADASAPMSVGATGSAASPATSGRL